MFQYATFSTNSNHNVLLKNLLLLQSSLKFSFVQNDIQDVTNLATVSVSLFPVLGVEYDFASYANTRIGTCFVQSQIYSHSV